MYLAQLDFEKIRSFSEPTSITFSKGINLLIGENNAGKSTILNIIQTLQVGVIGPSHISIEAQSANWLLVLKDLDDHFFGRIPRPSGFSASDAGGARYSCVLNKKEMQHH